MRITDYNRITDLKPSDIILLDSDTEGTRAIIASDLSKQLNKVLTNSETDKIPLGQRRMTYRGKKIGEIASEKQRQTIYDGAFEDLYIGDYWTIGGVNWRIADFDMYYGTHGADTYQVTEHHVIVVPDTCLYTYKMNDTSANTTGYFGSLMKTSGLNQAKITIANAFGSTAMLTYPITASDSSTGTTMRNSTIDLLDLTMVYGTMASNPSQYSQSAQLALFMLDPSYMYTGVTGYWLSTITASTFYLANSTYKKVDSTIAANTERGVRPFFALCGN